jgi:hypothetical protein
MKYVEDFAQGPAGWWGWNGNYEGLRPFERAESAIVARSPWWIDYNHAPPGAGYLHMLFCLNTRGPFGDAMKDLFGNNGFVQGKYPTNFTDAKMTLRLKGELLPRGANLVLLLQATADSLTSGWVLKAQPIGITADWSEQTLHLAPDPAQWVCLGSRHDRADYYGRIDLKTVLGNVNCNLMLILFPLQIKPMGPAQPERDRLRAGRDYPVWRSELPEGYVILDRVEIDFARTGK